ncbi:MAG: NAD(P)H-dependent oxidoreductase subunit E [Planctomycetota bacterium]
MSDTVTHDQIDAILDRLGRGPEMAIPLLQAVQREAGYVPRDAMEYIVAHSEIDAAQLYGVATFYTQFRLTPVGRRRIRVCHGTACHVAGATEVSEAVRDELGLADGEDTTADRFATVEEVACLGCCSLAPVAMVDETSHGKLTPDTARALVRRLREDDAADGSAA